MSDFLLCIISCHRYADRRRQQRETWLKDYPYDYKYFLGEGPQLDEPDTVCLPVPDDYDHLPAKVQAVVRWAQSRGYRQLFKTDDETYVAPGRLLPPTAEYAGKVERHESGCQWANGGPGYWLGVECIATVAAAPDATTGAEDKWVAHVLSRANIYPEHDPRYSMPGRGRDYPRPSNDVITFTGCCSISGAPSMYDIHKSFRQS